MANRKWTVDISGKTHLVEFKWSMSECSGEVYVDGNPAKTWGSGGSMPSSIVFNIEESKAVLKKLGGFVEDYSLYIGDKKSGVLVTRS